MTSGQTRAGLIYGVAAYGLWGLMPLYFRAVATVRPIELLAHRIVWSVLLLAALVTAWRSWPAVTRCLREGRTRWLLLASTVLLAANWFVFIYGVWAGQVVQNSLGYFINPLLNVLLGVLLFGEKLGRLRWAALGVAGFGLVYLAVALGEVPWLSLFLAGSFALYGLIRKVAPVDALVGLSVETALLVPPALAFLLWWSPGEHAAFLRQGWEVDALLLASGAVTAVPLLCFGAAARRLPLTTLGFLQYLAPSLQFLLAVLVLGEPFRPAQQVGFGCIWAALALASLGSVLERTGRRAAHAAASARHSGQPSGACPTSIRCARSSSRDISASR